MTSIVVELLGFVVCAVAVFAAGFAAAMRRVADQCEQVLNGECASMERTKGRLDVVAAILYPESKETPR